MMKLSSSLVSLSLFSSFVTSALASSGSWNVNANGNWSNAANWSPAVVPGTAPGDVIDFIIAISANRTITIDTTSRTAGVINIGDTNGNNSYIIARAGGATLTLDNSGLTAQINQTSTSGNNTISAQLVLADNLTLSNLSTNTLTVSGAIASSTGAFIITNSGLGTNSVVMSGIISNGTGTVSIVQNSATSALTLSGNNTYSGGVTLTSGALRVGTNSALGSGTASLNGGTLAALGGGARTLSNATVVGGDFIIGEAATGALTLSGPMNLGSAAHQITINNTTDTISGVISGIGGGITKAGAGTLILSNANSYTGPTTVNAGTLEAGAAITAFGNLSAVTMANVSGAILNLNGFNNIIGSLNGGGGAGGNVTLGSATLTTGSLNTPDSYAGIIAGTGDLTKTGANTMTLTGTNTYTGVTTFGNGTLSVATINNGGAAGNLGQASAAAANLVFDGGTLQYTGSTASTNRAFTINSAKTATFDITTNNLTVSGIVPSTSGGLTKIGAGTLTLSGANAYTGVTTFGNGVLSVATINNGGVAGNLGQATNAASNLVFDGGTLQYTGIAASTNRAFTINNAKTATFDITTNALTVSGAVPATTGALTKIGASILVLSGANAYTGATTVNAGTLRAGSTTNAFGNNSPVIMANVLGAILDLNGFNNTIGSLNGGGGAGGNVTLGSATLTTGALNTLDSFAGVISGTSGGLTKTGANTMTLTGTNTYTGVTTFGNGVLSVATINDGGSAGNLGQATSAASNLVFDGGTLQYTGSTASTNRAFTINSAKTATFDITTNNLTVSGIVPSTSGGLTKIGAGTLTLSGANAYTGVTTFGNGVLSVATINNGGVAGNLGQATNAASNLVFDGGTLQYTGIAASTNRAFTINNAKTATFDITTNALTVSGAVPATTGALTKIGASILVLSGANAYTGATTVNAGILRAGSPTNAFGNNSPVIMANVSGAILDLNGFDNTIGSLNGGGGAGGNVTLGSATLTTGALNTPDSFAGVISGTSGGLTKTGANTMTLTGTNTYTGVTTFGNGVLSVATIGDGGVAGNLGQASNAAANLVFDGGTLQYTGIAASTNRAFTINSAKTATFDITTSALTISGAVPATTGGLTKIGASILVLSGANAYTGTTTVNAGILRAGSTTNAFGNNSPVIMTNVSGAILDLNGFNNTIGSLNGGGGTGGNVILGSATLTTGALNTLDSFAGVISGTSGGLTKIGTSTLTLSGTNTYTGATTVSAGILQAGTTTSAFGINSAVSLANVSGAILNLNGFNNTIGSLNGGGGTGGNVTLGSATLTTGSLNTPDSFAGVISGTNGGLTKTGANTMTLTGTNTYTGVTTFGNGVLSVATINNGGVAGNLGQASNAAANLVFDGGTLQYTGSTASTDRNFTINSGKIATFDIMTNTLTISGATPATTGGLTKIGAGTLILSTANAYIGPTTVNAGVLQAGVATNAFGNNSAVSLANISGAILNLNGFNNTIGSLNGGGGTGGNVTLGSATLTTGSLNTFDTYTGVISGSLGGLTKTGNNVMILAGTNTYTGATTVNSGVLQAGTTTSAFGINSAVSLANVSGAILNLNGYNNTIGSLSGGGGSGGNVNLGSATLTTGASNTLDTYAGVISGTSGGLTKTGANTMTLTGTNTYTGVTTLTNGTLSVATIGNGGAPGNIGAASNAAANLVFDGGALQYTGLNAGTDRNFTISNGKVATFDITTNTLTISGATPATTGGLTKMGAGTLILSGANAYIGDTTINAGVLQAGGPTNAFGNNSAVFLANVSNAILNLNGFDNTIGSLNGGGGSGGNVTLGSATLTTGASNTFDVYSGVISGLLGSLTKTGTDTMVLSGNNTYTGGTTISQGTLSIDHSSAIGSAANTLAIQSGATFQTTASFITARQTTLSGTGEFNGGIIDVASSSQLTYQGSTLLIGSGSLIKTSAGTLVLDSTNTYAGGTYLKAGTITVTTDSSLGLIPLEGNSDYSLTIYDGATLAVSNGSWSSRRKIHLQSGQETVTIASGQYILRNGGSNNDVDGSGTLFLNGQGNCICGAANTSTGGVIVENGILQINNTSGSATGTGAVTVQNNGTLSGLRAQGLITGDTGSISGPVTINNTGTLLTESGETLTLGSLSMIGGSASTFNLGTWTTTPLVTVTGALSLPSGSSAISVVNTGTMQANIYTLFTYGSASNLGNFTLASNHVGGFNLALDTSTIPYVNLDVTDIINQWKKAVPYTNSNWTTDANWWDPPHPDGVGEVAQFLNNNGDPGFGSTETVNLDAPITVGTVVFNNETTAFTISGANTLTLDNGAGDALIQVVSASSTDHIISVPLALTNNLSASIFSGSGSHGLTISGVISGIGQSLTKTGTGPLTLSGPSANTFDGITTVNAGELILAKSTPGLFAIGSGELDILASGAATLNSSSQMPSTIILSVNGTFHLQNNTQTIDSISGLGSITTTSGGVLTIASGADCSFPGTISGNGGIAKDGAGTLTLSGANSYSGGTTVTLGAISIDAENHLGASSGAVTMNGGALYFSGGFTSSRTALLDNGGGTFTTNNNFVTWTGAIQSVGTGDFTKSGAGTLDLTHANTYTGETHVNQGTLRLSNASALGSSSQVTILSSGELSLNSLGFNITAPIAISGGRIHNIANTNTISGNISLSVADSFITVDADTLILSGIINGSTGITKDGAGIARLDNANIYTGDTHINAGTLRAGVITNAFGNLSAVTLANVAGANLDLNGLDNTIGPLNGGGNAGGNVNLGIATLTVNDLGANSTFSGVISGAGALYKTGSGTMTLAGINDYDGGTTIALGALQVAQSSALGADANPLAIDNNTALQTTGTFTTSRATTLSGFAFIDVAGGTTLTYTGSNTIVGAGSLNVTGAGTLVLNSSNNYLGGTSIGQIGQTGTLVVFNNNSAGPQPPAGSPLYAFHIFKDSTLLIENSSFTTERQIELMGTVNSDLMTVTVTDGFTQQRNGLIYGTGSLLLNGSGTMVFTNYNNSYSGATTVMNGAFQVNAISISGSVTSSGAVTVTNNAILKGPNAGFVGKIAGLVTIQDTAQLIAQNTTTLTLSGGLTLEGNITNQSRSVFQLGAWTATPIIDVTGGTFAVSGPSLIDIVNTGGMQVPPSLQSYYLFQYSGTPDLSQLSLATTSIGTFNLSLDKTAPYVALNVTSLTDQWKKAVPYTNSNWSNPDNWYGAVPINPGDTARFINNNGSPGFGANEPVIVDVPVTVGSIHFDNTTTAFTISSPSSFNLTLNNNLSDAIIQVLNVPSSTNHTISAPLVLSNNLNVTISSANQNFGLEISSAISGSHTLTKNGPGLLTLSGALANVYSGPTIVTAGTLILNKITGPAIGATQLQIDLGANTTLMASNQINSSIIAVNVNGTFALNTFSETIGTLVGQGNISIGSGGNLTVAGNGNSTFSGPITGLGAITKTGSGIFTLLGLNSYSGGTTINAGTISIDEDHHLGGSSGAITMNGGTLQFGAGFTSDAAREMHLNGGGGTLDTINNSVTWAGLIQGSGAFTKIGSGILNLTHANTFSGATQLSEGTLQIGNQTALGNSPFVTVSAGAELEINGTGFIIDRSIILSGGSLCNLANTNTYSGTVSLTSDSFVDADADTAILYISNIVSGGFGITKIGPGIVQLLHANTYTGSTIISEGTLQAGALTSAFGANSAVTLTNALGVVFDLNGFSNTIGSLQGGGILGGDVHLGLGTLTTGGKNTNTTFSGIISGVGGSLSKTGSGIMTLTGNNSYTGGTIISQGTLSIDHSSAIGSATNTLAIQNGATFQTTASFITARQTTLSGTGEFNGGVIDVASGSELTYQGLSTIIGSGSLIKTSAGTLVLDSTNTYAGGTYLKGGITVITNDGSLGLLPIEGSSDYALTIYDGATLAVSNSSWTSIRKIHLQSGLETVTIASGQSILRSGGSNNDVDGSGALFLNGQGTCICGAANTFTGGAIVENGILQINNTSGSATGTGAVTVQNNGTLSGMRAQGLITGDTGSISGPVTIDNTGSLLTESGETLTLGSLSMIGGSTSTFNLGTWTTTPLVTVTGALSLPAGSSAINVVNTGTMQANTYTLFAYGSASNLGSFTLASNHVGGFNLALNTSINHFVNLDVTDILNQWKKDATNNWTTDANWWDPPHPAGIGAVAQFLNNNGVPGFGSAETVNLNAPITVGTVVFNNENTAFTISGANTLTLNNGAGGALIQVLSAPTTDHIISVPLTLTNNLSASIFSGSGVHGLTISGVISGIGQHLTKTGTGPLTLSGPSANTFDGITTVNAGELILAKSAPGVFAIGSGELDILASGAATLNSSSQMPSTTILSVNGTFNLQNNTQTIGSITGLGSITTTSGGVLTIANSANCSFPGTISGNGGIAKDGVGTLTLSGANSYSGGTTITLGTISVDAENQLGATSGAVTMNGGTLYFSSGFTSIRTALLDNGGGTFTTNNNLVTWTGAIQSVGTGNFTKSGAGTLDLTHANTYTGETHINQGTLRLSNASALGSSSQVTILSGGELSLNSLGFNITAPFAISGGRIRNIANTNTISGNISLSVADSFITVDADTLILSGIINGSTGITKDGSGIARLDNANTYTGATHINAGTLRAGAMTSAFGNLSAVTLANVAGANLDLNGFDNTIGPLNGGGNAGGNVNLGIATLTINDLGATSSFSGVISGAGALYKTGSGTMTLAGINDYDGGTTIAQGALQVAQSSALGQESNALIIESGAILKTTGSFTTARSTTLNGVGATLGATIFVENATTLTSIGASSITGTGSLIKDGLGTVVLNSANTYEGGTFLKQGAAIITNVNSFGQTPVEGSSNYALTIYNGATVIIEDNSFTSERKIYLKNGTDNISVSSGFFVLRDGGAQNDIDDAGIGDAGTLHLNGLGTFIFAASNQYSGGTLVENGVLQINNSSGSATGSGNVVVQNNGTLSGLRLQSPITHTGTISKTVDIENSGKLLMLSGETLSLGGLTLNTGALSIFKLNELPTPSLVDITTSNLFTVPGISPVEIVNAGAMTTGTYDLFSYTGTAPNHFLELTQTQLGLFNLELIYGSNVVQLNVTSNIYQRIDGGVDNNWSTTGNWLGPVPNSIDAGAQFTDNNGSGFGATLNTIVDVPVTVGSITLKNASTVFTIVSPTFNAITLNSTALNALIQVLDIPSSSHHTISAPLILDNNLNVAISTTIPSTYGLVLSGAIIDNNSTKTLTKLGPNPLILSGLENNSIGGLTIVEEGSLILNKAANVHAIGQGGLFIEPNTFTQLNAPEQFDHNAPVTVEGTLDLNQYSTTIGTLHGIGTVVMDAGATLTVSGNTNSSFSGQITGQGNLTKEGNGILTLTGVNDYLGQTDINAGALEINQDTSLGNSSNPILFNGGTLLLSQSMSSNRFIEINDLGATLQTNNNLVTWAGLISDIGSGIGTLTKTGPGVLDLTGANNYSGDTIVSQDILRVSNALALGNSPSVTLQVSGELELNGNGLVFSTPLILNGGEICNLVNTNTYAGPITLKTDSIVDADTDTSILIITSAIQEQNGSFGITKIGPGAVRLAHANQYTGHTIVAEGTLQAAAANALGINSAVTIENTAGAILELMGYDQTIGSLSFGGASGGEVILESAILTTGTLNTNDHYDGIISGSGGLTKTGSGTMILSRSNTYNGSTSVLGGTLQAMATNAFGLGTEVTIGSATLDLNGYDQTIRSLSGNGNVLLGSAILTIGGSNNAPSYTGIISGPGSLIKTQLNELILNGNNSYSGGTIINGGTVTVGNRNALGVGNVALNNATLNLQLTHLLVGGNYTQNGSSTLKVAIKGTNSGSIESVGAATINSTDRLVVKVSNYIPNGATYSIAFGSSGSALAIPELIVKGHTNAKLTAETTGDLLTIVAKRNPHYLSQSAQDENAKAVAEVLSQMTNPSKDMAHIIEFLNDLSPAELSQVLNTLYPEIDAGVININRLFLGQLIEFSRDRMKTTSTEEMTGISTGDDYQSRGLWSKVFGCDLNQDELHRIAGYNAWTAGFALGGDHLFQDTLLFGVSFGYAYGQVDSQTVQNQETTADSLQAVLYGGFSDRDSALFLDWEGFYAHNWYSNQREIDLGKKETREAKANYTGDQVAIYMDGGYRFYPTKTIQLAPLLSLHWNYLDLASYTESGANALDLSVGRQSYNQLQSGLGARVMFNQTHGCNTFRPELHIRWFYDFIGDAMTTTSNFTGGGFSFATNGAKPAQNSFNVGGQLTLERKNNYWLMATCDVEMRNQFWGVYSSLTFGYQF